MKNLKNLLDGNKLKSDIQFKKLCINSNDIDPGDIFVALKNSSKRDGNRYICLLYTSPSPRDQRGSRMPSSA